MGVLRGGTFRPELVQDAERERDHHCSRGGVTYPHGEQCGAREKIETNGNEFPFSQLRQLPGQPAVNSLRGKRRSEREATEEQENRRSCEGRQRVFHARQPHSCRDHRHKESRNRERQRFGHP